MAIAVACLMSYFLTAYFSNICSLSYFLKAYFGIVFEILTYGYYLCKVVTIFILF